jgi:hypothetical protein
VLKLGLIVLALFGVAADAAAQVVRGTVRDAETGAPLQGVFVMLVDSAGQMRGGVLTNAQGTYATRAPLAGTFTLRAERIGHQSANSTPVVLSATEAQTVDITVKVMAIALAPVEVSSRNRCIARPRTGQRTAQLWEEARKALTVARWVENQKQIQFSARTYVRELEAGTMRVKSEGVRHNVSRSLPYAAIPADSLARHGFVRNEGGGYVFYGPDADVLLSSAFLNSHCFHSLDGSGATQGMVGLGFRPTTDSRLPDIEGVLWLDRKTLELRHIEYRYTNLGAEYRVKESGGGRTEFLRLKSGAWVVSKWHIRMPTVVASPLERGEFRVIALQEEGGEVLSVSDAESAQTLTHDGIVKGIVYDSVAGSPLADALVYLSGTSYQAKTDKAGRFEITGVPAGKYTVGFSHAVLDSMPTFPDARTIDVRQLESATVDLGTKSVLSQLAAKCPGYRRGLPMDSAGGVIFGHVRNERASAIANAEVIVSWKRYKRGPANRSGVPYAEHSTRAIARTDGTGFYVLCDVPLERPLEVRVSRSDEPATRVPMEIIGRPYRRLDFTLKD